MDTHGRIKYQKHSRKYGWSFGGKHALEDGVGNCTHDELHKTVKKYNRDAYTMEHVTSTCTTTVASLPLPAK